MLCVKFRKEAHYYGGNVRHIRELLINPKEVAESLERFSKNTREIDRFIRRLAKKYPKKFLAYSPGGQFILGLDLASLLKETDRRNIPRRSLIFAHLTKPPKILIIAAESRRP